jgi:type IV pilus assembly protein PilQ
MDEKKLPGSGRKMTKPIRNTLVGCIFFHILLAVLLLFSPAANAEGEGSASQRHYNVSPSPYGDDEAFFLPSPTKVDMPPDRTAIEGSPSPVLAAINVTQAGSDTLQVRFRGRSIPTPRQVSAPGENKLVIQFDRISFPRVTDKLDWWEEYEWDVFRLDPPGKNTWWKQFDLPLIDRVNAERYRNEGVRLTFTTSKPLVIDSIEGLPGSDNIMVVLKAYRPPRPEPAPERPPTYGRGDPLGINAPVTLQLKDVDLKMVFMMLADNQRLNLFLDPSVPDMTIPSIIFNGVPFNEAFSYLLRVAELSYSMQGNTLVVGKKESLGTLLDKNITRAYNLGYAVDTAGQLRSDIVASLTGLVPLAKPPTVDGRNRTLYVTATEEQHKEIAAVLEKLDRPGQQIMLQAKIVEVTDGGQQQLEQVISAVYDRWLANFSSAGVRLGFNQGNRGFAEMNMNLPVGGTTLGDNQVVISNTVFDAGEKLLMVGLNALESNNKGKVLAHPSVIAIDGQEARVSLTTNMTYSSGTDSNGNTSFSDVEVGPQLSFTPIIGRDGWVTIKIQIETGSIVRMLSTGYGAETPETTTRRVETVVRVRDGEPFAVGGLYQETKSSNRSRIPVLGYIPLLGDLFTTRSERHDKSEVAIIVIPYILDVTDEGISTFDLQKSTLSTR